tara:strand:- start:807 stop:1055 length:249 start_codon:yes stop_codon:yes gene_type:complete
MRDKELQPLNMLLKLPDEETVVVLSAGTLDKEVQSLNIPDRLVAAAVLSKGIAARDVHALNMSSMPVTAAVLSKGTVVKDVH